MTIMQEVVIDSLRSPELLLQTIKRMYYLDRMEIDDIAQNLGIYEGDVSRVLIRNI